MSEESAESVEKETIYQQLKTDTLKNLKFEFESQNQSNFEGRNRDIKIVNQSSEQQSNNLIEKLPSELEPSHNLQSPLMKPGSNLLGRQPRNTVKVLPPVLFLRNASQEMENKSVDKKPLPKGILRGQNSSETFAISQLANQDSQNNNLAKSQEHLSDVHHHHDLKNERNDQE